MIPFYYEYIECAKESQVPISEQEWRWTELHEESNKLSKINKYVNLTIVEVSLEKKLPQNTLIKQTRPRLSSNKQIEHPKTLMVKEK